MLVPKNREEIETQVHAKVAEYFTLSTIDIEPETSLLHDCGGDEGDVDHLLVWCYETYGVDITGTQTEEIETVDDLVSLINTHRLNNED